MTDLWDEKPEPDHDWSNGIYRRSYYSQKRMDAWLEKVKPELDKLEAIGKYIGAQAKGKRPAYEICVGVLSILEGEE